MSQPECVVKSGDRLGEGPFWDDSAGRLYWFDIKGLRLHWLEPASGETGRFELSVRASAGAARREGGLILSTERGLANFDSKDGRLDIRYVCQAAPGFRSNDGKIDLTGRFWWSMMDDDDGRRPGFVERYDATGRSERMIDQVNIANTVSVSPDGRAFYFADSARKTLFVYDLDPATGALGARREFAKTEGAAAPDGAAVDEHGFLWNCQWGGARIVRYAPDGRIDRVVETPVTQPTSCAFGGPGLRTLYVTSAWDGLSDDERAAQPLAGALFAFEPGVAGLKLPPFPG
jgi:sugar lactone lactonase YvrE